MEMLDLLLSVLLGVISGVISGTVIIKLSFSSRKLTEKIEDVIDIFIQNTQNQEVIFKIGALLGNGIINGAGLKQFTPKRAGKWWEPLIAQFAPAILEQMMGKQPKTLNPLETQ